MIPDNVDIVVSHCPPYGHGDKMYRRTPCGNTFLAKKIAQCHPALSVFGHIHEMYGVERDEHTTYVNCALLSDEKTIRKPIVVTLQDKRVVSVDVQGKL